MESKLLGADRAHSIIDGFFAVYNHYGYRLAMRATRVDPNITLRAG